MTVVIVFPGLSKPSRKNETWPTSLLELGFEYEVIPTTDGNYEIGVYDDGIIGIALGADATGEESAKKTQRIPPPA